MSADELLIPASRVRPVMVIAPGQIAGAEKVVLMGVAALKQAGCDPLVVVIKESRAPRFAEDFVELIPAAVERKVVLSDRAFDHRLPFRMKSILAVEPASAVVHTHGFKALIACRLTSGHRRHVHTHHGNTAHTLKVVAYEYLASAFMKRCSAVCAVSAVMKEGLLTSLRPYERISVVENMLSIANVEELRRRRRERLATRRSDEGETLNLTFIGRLSPEKGLIEFFRYFASSPVKHRFRITVVGDGPERQAVRRFIDDQQLASQVAMVGFDKNPSRHLVDADLVIMPSHREGLPMVLIEALSAGVPVLASNVGAICSVVVNDRNGYLVDRHSPEAWQAGLFRTLDRLPTWQAAACADARTIEERFSPELWARKTIMVYRASSAGPSESL